MNEERPKEIRQRKYRKKEKWIERRRRRRSRNYLKTGKRWKWSRCSSALVDSFTNQVVAVACVSLTSSSLALVVDSLRIRHLQRCLSTRFVCQLVFFFIYFFFASTWHRKTVHLVTIDYHLSIIFSRLRFFSRCKKSHFVFRFQCIFSIFAQLFIFAWYSLEKWYTKFAFSPPFFRFLIEIWSEFVSQF